MAPPGPDEPKAVFKRWQTFGKDSPDFRTWFRGEHTNFNPSVAQMAPLEAVGKYVLHGWLPEVPQITRDTKITAFGSCFAENISNWFTARNFRIVNDPGKTTRAYVVTMREGMVNSFAIRQQFEWAWENKTFDGELWHGYDAETFGYNEDVRLETKAMFDETDVFILTFGLSEVWYDEPTGNVFWRTIPKDVYDPARHKFRVSSVAENRDNILAIHRLIRRHRPGAKLIVSLSPIPLIATFRDVGCLTANAVSKATLRVAIDEALREAGGGDLYYWPSYELVTDVFQLPYKPDRRHMKQEVLDHIMRLFETTWCSDSEVSELELLESWAAASAAAGLLPEAVGALIPRRRAFRLGELIRRGTALHDDADVAEARRGLLRRLRSLWIETRQAGKAGADLDA